MDAEEDLDAMAWPGFVDILSSVIIMFVFFVLVVASALYFHIIIFKNKVLSEMNEYTQASANAVELADTNRFLMEKIEELESKLKLSETPSDANEVQLYQVNTEFAESERQEVKYLEEEDGILILFGQDSISVTEDNRVKVLEFIAGRSVSSDVTVKIISARDPTALNDIFARKLAVSRMLNVRNVFLDGEIPIGQVVPSISGDEKLDGTYNWVKIIFEEK